MELMEEKTPNLSMRREAMPYSSNAGYCELLNGQSVKSSRDILPHAKLEIKTLICR